MGDSEIGSVRRKGRWILIEGICLLNFLSFMTVDVMIGGSAPLGKNTGNHFFVGDHGRLTEVSHLVYSYSWVHSLSQLVTLPLFVVAAVKVRKAAASWRLRGRGAVEPGAAADSFRSAALEAEPQAVRP